MTKPRNRSQSGAHEPCPTCGRLLRGAKGLKSHMAEMHGEEAPKAAKPYPWRPATDPVERRGPATDPQEIDRVEAELRQTMAAAPFPDAAHPYGLEHPESLP